MSFCVESLCLIYSSDDNYVQHLGASIYSLLDKNRDFKQVRIYVIDNSISKCNKEKLSQIIVGFSNAQLFYISFDKWKEQLQVNMEWDISLSSYARLFVGSMLPREVDRVLYLDCDMIVCDSLKSLWKTDFSGKILGAVQDSVSDSTKGAVGLMPRQRYFNAGMLLIDLAAWRKANIEEECRKFIRSHQGNVHHHDQGVLNGVLSGKIFFLPLRYNLMTIHYIFNRKKILRYFGEHAHFWTDSEIEKAKEKPVILHYTPSFTVRPWIEGCHHPLANLYWDNLACTPWRKAVPQINCTKWYVRLIEWRYRCLPF